MLRARRPREALSAAMQNARGLRHLVLEPAWLSAFVAIYPLRLISNSLASISRRRGPAAASDLSDQTPRPNNPFSPTTVTGMTCVRLNVDPDIGAAHTCEQSSPRTHAARAG